MAVQRHIAGPVTIEYGGTDAGRTDGNVRIAITMIEPSIPVTDDSAGGMQVDEIQQDSQALVRLVFSSRDRAVIQQMRSRLRAANTFALEGEAQTPGLLRRGNAGAARTLVLRGSNLTANGGMPQITFHDAIADAETDIEESEIGSEASRLAITMRAYPLEIGGTWKVYDIADIV